MGQLIQIQDDVRGRVEEILSTHGEWPCRKGCDECCRRLAAVPRVSREEWVRMEAAIAELPREVAEGVWGRIRQSEGKARPVVCPLLDVEAGTCLIYEARPIACRSYGFCADWGEVLGCGRIEQMARENPDVVWGNHARLEERMDELGPALELFRWSVA